MRASPIEVDRPVEPERGVRHVVEGRLGADLVKANAERLGGIEPADDRILGEARKPARLLVLFDPLLIPAHEHMFAYAPVVAG
jgi:hypothetical protein